MIISCLGNGKRLRISPASHSQHGSQKLCLMQLPLFFLQTGEKTADSCQKLIGHGRVGAVTLESRSRYGAAGTLLFLTRTATASCSARAPAQPGCASCGQVGRPPVHRRLPVAESEDCASAGACSRASAAAGAAAAAAGMGSWEPPRPVHHRASSPPPRCRASSPFARYSVKLWPLGSAADRRPTHCIGTAESAAGAQGRSDRTNLRCAALPLPIFQPKDLGLRELLTSRTGTGTGHRGRGRGRTAGRRRTQFCIDCIAGAVRLRVRVWLLLALAVSETLNICMLHCMHMSLPCVCSFRASLVKFTVLSLLLF